MSMQKVYDAYPRSCDTFVALPTATSGGRVIFGKNSDRPEEEVQEVVYEAPADHPDGSKVKCTYIEIPQATHTYAVVLSKPSWMWGAEMGANEHGVCIGNEAVWTKLNGPEDKENRLLGMDMVRLGLERSKTAKEALKVITGLLTSYGQGGNCAEEFTMTYHNSFLICDQSEAWILETAGPHWAAENVKSGVRNISNELSIRTKIDASSDNLQEFAKSKGWWKPENGEFDFAKAYSSDFMETDLTEDDSPCGRYQWGRKLLEDGSKGGFGVSDMLSILRHEESGICMTGSFTSTGSQVSVLPPADSGSPCCHWFTGTPDPNTSFYKPFVFCDGASIGQQTTSPQTDKGGVSRAHPLWKAHEVLRGWMAEGNPKGEALIQQIRELESNCLADMEEILGNFDERSKARVAPIFQHMVDLEMNFYK